MVLEKLKELSEMLETNQNVDWIENDPSVEFEHLKKIVDSMCEDFNVLNEYEEAGYFGLNWSLPDIISKAEEMGVECSEDEAREIAYEIEQNGDCEYGITWDTIAYYIGQHFDIDQ
jgi:hypothetical protein